MATYSVLDNNVVINIVVADSKEDAEQATGKECIEFTTDKLGVIGAVWNGETFIVPRSPFAPPIEE